tara:strand:+ start:284 stop:577 length:294 start_codon:yes stop_codon:yes gene_type:complete
MTLSITYSGKASQDVIKIYQDTAKQWGINQADKYDSGLVNTLKLLQNNPYLGRDRSDIHKGYHHFKYERHIIFYKIRQHDLLIIRILHERMDAVRHI